MHIVLLCAAAAALSACGGAQSRQAKHMQKGHEFFAAGNYAKARVEFQNALQITPTDAEVRYENGLVDEKLAKQREAAQFYQGAIDVNPEHVGARARLGRLYLLFGAPDRALDIIAPAIATHPDDAELLTVRAAARIQRKDPSGALADAERAVQIAPTNEDAVAVLSGLYSSSHQGDKAQALLERSIKLVPDSVDLRIVLAQLYASQNNRTDTEAVLLDLVRLRPLEKSHRIRLAQFYGRTDQLDAGERTLRQAIKDLPAELDLKLALVDFLSARRSPQAAESQLQAMIAAAPDNSELKLALAKFYEINKRPDQAEAIYSGIIAAKKYDAAGLGARDRLAALRLQRHDDAGAMQLLNEVLAQSPRDDDALLLRGEIALLKQDPRAAIADLRAVLRDQPNAVGVQRTLARAHLANGEPAIAEETMRAAVDANPGNLAVKLEFAQILITVGKPELAKPILAELIKAQPDNADALDAEFRVNFNAKDYVAAKAAADSLVAARPKSASGYLYQGKVAEAGGHSEDAIRLYAAAVDVQPDAVEPLQDEIRLLVAGNRSEEALKRLDDLTAKHPGNPMGLDGKGEVLMHQGKVALAQVAFNEAIARSPTWWVAYRDLANAQLIAKDENGAIATLRRGKGVVVEADALDTFLGTVLQRAGRTDEAIAEYEELLRRNPAADVAANNLAMLLATVKKDPASLDRAKALTARFADSPNPSFLDTYGWVLFKRGDAAASLPVLQRVVASAPSEPIAHYHLGMAQSQLGSSAEARVNLTLAVNSNANFSGREEAKATLDRLPKT